MRTKHLKMTCVDLWKKGKDGVAKNVGTIGPVWNPNFKSWSKPLSFEHYSNTYKNTDIVLVTP